jgi:two-component system response regulator HydG
MTQNDSIVLVVDDERDHADGIVEALEKSCGKAIAVYNGRDAVEILREQRIDVVVTDLRLEDDVSGLEVLAEAKKANADTQVILITAYATIDTCRDALKQGASDYLVKPIDVDELRTMVERACRKPSVVRVNVRPVAEFEFEGVRGSNPIMHGIFEVVRRVAPTNITVLIEGESGTGKEVLARAIHANSRRRNKAFKPVNCAGLSESILESELFGHAKGAFTGAGMDRQGLFEAADKGTLFLDEIGDMPLPMQAKLLRVLEDGIVVPVGSNKPVSVDVRVISATNHDLIRLIEEKKFRQDLYFRIKGVSITLPPLRARTEDFAELANAFLEQACDEIGRDIKGFTDSAMAVLAAYPWPGNIRQLRNAIRTMVVMCDKDKIDIRDVPPDIYRPRQLAAPAISVTAAPSVPVTETTASLEDMEKQAIIKTLAETGGNREKTAKLLGIGERTLYRKIKEYNL